MTPKTAEPRAGEVWDASLDPIRGVEQAGFRPVLIVSNDWFNRLHTSLVLVIPITGTHRGLRYQVEIEAGEGGLSKASVAMCEQVRSIDRRRLARRRGVANPTTLARAREIVSMIIMDDPYIE
jgi:mRNA interferase MazF